MPYVLSILFWYSYTYLLVDQLDQKLQIPTPMVFTRDLPMDVADRKIHS